MSVVISLMAIIAVELFFAGLRRIRTPGYEAQIAQYGSLAHTGPRSRYARWVRPYALRLASNVTALRGLTDFEKTARMLDYAGNPAGMTVHEFHGVQLYGGLAGLLIGGVWFALGLPLGAILLVILPLGGFFYPLLWLRGRVKQRQHAITVALPDLLDMLAVCVSAGMGFDIALTLLVERGEGPLYEEMGRMLHELQMGAPREQAFRNLAARNSSDALRGFIDALLQAEELGSPIATTLERQAEDIRTGRRYRAREEGAKAATKITLIVVVLVTPSVLCLIIAALGMSIMRSTRGLPLPG